MAINKLTMNRKYQFINEDLLEHRSNLPWVEKYRPELINNIVSHAKILTILTNLINKNNFPNVIFYGPPGTGKTTTILACAKQMYGESISNMVLELNGSDERGINVVREQINFFAQNNDMNADVFNINKKKQKLVILDEADSMTFDAQFALRSVIELSIKTTRFCLICNYSTKIIESLQSRCTVFRFPPIPDTNHIEHLNFIIQHEQINIESDVIERIVSISLGDMRRSISILQSLFMVYEHNSIDMNMLYNNICQPLPQEMTTIVENIFSVKIRQSFAYAKRIEVEKSLSINDILNNIVSYIVTNKIYGVAKTARVISLLSNIEYNLAGNTNYHIQLCGIIAALKM